MNNLYETDFVAWVGRNVELLRSGRFDEVDVINVAEEIESLGRSDRREFKGRIVDIIEHLLKLKLPQPSERSWRVSVVKQRIAVANLLEESPSLRTSLTQEFLAMCHCSARQQLCIEGVEAPEEYIFTWEEILGEI
jgi:hypothetical protein